MNKILMLLVFMFIMTGLVYAADGKETLTVSSTVVKFTNASVIDGTYTKAVCTVEDDTVSFWTTGDSPTSTLGLKGIADSIINLSGSDLAKFKAIRVTGDAVLNCQFWRY